MISHTSSPLTFSQTCLSSETEARSHNFTLQGLPLNVLGPMCTCSMLHIYSHFFLAEEHITLLSGNTNVFTLDLS